MVREKRTKQVRTKQWTKNNKSKIKFNDTKFSYEPHCTLKLAKDAEHTEEQMLERLQPPNQDFIIDTMSVYSINKDQQIPRLLHRVNLGKLRIRN